MNSCMCIVIIISFFFFFIAPTSIAIIAQQLNLQERIQWKIVHNILSKLASEIKEIMVFFDGFRISVV